MGSSQFFKDNFYPKALIEINGKPMIQHVVENFDCFLDKKLIAIVSDSECSEFHIDKSISILTNDEAEVIRLKKQTAGALCTSLMAVDYINNDTALIITNCDQIIDIDFVDVIEGFQETNLDCGVLCFKNIHPRWSYVLAEEDRIVEAAEKRPLSDKAIAGFYYYRKGSIFVEAAKQVLKKGSAYKDKYYISSSINEIILAGKQVGYRMIEGSQYHSFYSPAKINDYEKKYCCT